MSSVSQRTRSKSSGVLCAHCKVADADYYLYTKDLLLSCGRCERVACTPCSESTWVNKAGCCVRCVRRLAGLDETDGSRDQELIHSLPCPHINKSTYSGCTAWRCHDCGAMGLYACEHKQLSEPNFMGDRVCLECKRLLSL